LKGSDLKPVISTVTPYSQQPKFRTNLGNNNSYNGYLQFFVVNSQKSVVNPW